MDIKKYREVLETGVDLELKTAAGLPMLQSDGKTPVTVRVTGSDSPRWTRVQDAIADRHLANFKPNQPPYKSTKERREDEAALLAAITLGWNGLTVDGSADGESLPYSQDNAVKLYLDPTLRFIKDQVDEYVGERKNFWKASLQS